MNKVRKYIINLLQTNQEIRFDDISSYLEHKGINPPKKKEHKEGNIAWYYKIINKLSS